MYLRMFIPLIILIAIVTGILSILLPNDQLIKLIHFHDFFDASLPILAFGALVKYLCTTCTRCFNCHHQKNITPGDTFN